MTLMVRSSPMPVSAEELFAFHADVTNLPRISPPFPPFALLTPPKPTEAGDLQVMRLGWQLIGVDWHAHVTRVVPGSLIEDVQEKGPFLRWRHQHRIESGPCGSVLTDVVAFRFLPTRAGEFLEFFLLRPGIAAMFAYRHRKTRQLLMHHKN